MASYCFQCFHPIAPGEAVCPRCGRDHSVNDQPEFALPPGTLLHAGKYLVGKVLGQGGFGITYIGFDLALEMRVAIKEFFPMNLASRSADSSLIWHSSVSAGETVTRESFVKEARKMAKTDSIPGVVQVKDIFYENNTSYIVMGYIEGETLKARLGRTGTLRPQAALECLMPVMKALKKAHAVGLIHRDISPDNIMLDRSEEVWLLDLGAAKDLDASQGSGTQSTAPVMKRGFSPPEQCASGGRIGPWTDVYAMCATVYYCVVGKVPPEAMDRVLGAELGFPDGFPPALKQALTDGMALRQEERTQDMETLMAALRASCADAKPAVAPPATKPAGAPPKEKPAAAPPAAKPAAVPPKEKPAASKSKGGLPLAAKLGLPLVLCAVIAGAVLLRGRSGADKSGSGDAFAPVETVAAAASGKTPKTSAPVETAAASAVSVDPNLQYVKYETVNGEITITGYDGEPVNLGIPAEIGGVPVTGIGENAFKYCHSLVSVTIPEME